MARKILWIGMTTLFILSPVALGQTHWEPYDFPWQSGPGLGSCSDLRRSLCFWPMPSFPFLFDMRICELARALRGTEDLLKAGEQLTKDALETFTYDSLRDSLHRLLAALDKFSKRIEQLKRQAALVCPRWYLHNDRR